MTLRDQRGLVTLVVVAALITALLLSLRACGVTL